jgi:hypothetical protein
MRRLGQVQFFMDFRASAPQKQAICRHVIAVEM